MEGEKVLIIWTLGLSIPNIYSINIRGGFKKHSMARGVHGGGEG